MEENFDYQGKRPDQIEKSNKTIKYMTYFLLIMILIKVVSYLL